MRLSNKKEEKLKASALEETSVLLTVDLFQNVCLPALNPDPPSPG